MIRFTDKRITDGRNVWNVSGLARFNRVELNRVEGDVTDAPGLRAAVSNLVASKPRYRRVIEG